MNVFFFLIHVFENAVLHFESLNVANVRFDEAGSGSVFCCELALTNRKVESQFRDVVGIELLNFQIFLFD